MQKVMNIGAPPWIRSDILDHLDEFESIYADRPIKDNQGGMKAPHMFAVWFIAKQLSPDLIVESGVWKGQSTWLLEKACPEAKLISIDLNLGRRQYISDRAIYSEKDFVEQDWSAISNRSLVFFDDHQNAYTRLQQCKWFGFKHVIFEDNYPNTRGDCYSLKKAFANAGFNPANPGQNTSNNNIFKKILKKSSQLRLNAIINRFRNGSGKIAPNDVDSKLLQKNLDIYYEFPPIFKPGKTRWGDDWEETSYPTPKPILEQSNKTTHKVFWDEALSYTWICYVMLK